MVIPTHNRSQWLQLTLRSALWQVGVELEVIVVDDGSTDTTPEVVEAIRDARVRLIRHERPQGVSASRNHGASEARGEWIAFLDDDDLWAPEKVSRQVDAAVTAGRTWAYTGAVNVDERLRILSGRVPVPPEEAARLIFRHNVIPGGGSNVLVRRDALKRAGPFDLRLKNTEDWEMWIRLARQGPPAWVPDPLMAYRLHSRNASLDVTAILSGIDLIERRHGTRADRGVIHRWLAESLLRTGQRGEALRHLALAARGGQARGVASDVLAILRRRMARVRGRTPVPKLPPTDWTSLARRWLDDLSRDPSVKQHGLTASP